MASYRQIQDRVKSNDGFVPKTCWIADVKASYGLTARQAPNRQSLDSGVHPCPPSKRQSIEAALRFFEMIK